MSNDARALRSRQRQNGKYLLRPYVASPTPKSIAALRNLERVYEERLTGRRCIEVMDLLKYPQLAQSDQILAVPTIVRKLARRICKVIGDISYTERVLAGLDLRPHEADLFAPRKKEEYV
jgi:circadian clock protein KaiB